MSGIISNEKVCVVISTKTDIEVETFYDLTQMVEHYTINSIEATDDPQKHIYWLTTLRRRLTKTIARIKKEY